MSSCKAKMELGDIETVATSHMSSARDFESCADMFVHVVHQHPWQHYAAYWL